MAKLKAAISIVVILTLAVAVGVEWQTIQELRQENDTLRQQAAQVASLQDRLDQASRDAASVGSATETQKRELVHLRTEVSKLQGQGKELSKAQQEIAELHKKLDAADEDSKTQAAALEAEAQKRQDLETAHATHNATDACINNLRLIDAAKQQWALENKKTSDDTPTWDDLRPYLGKGPNGDLPTCPNNGAYTIGTVAEKPTCSIAGHVLP